MKTCSWASVTITDGSICRPTHDAQKWEEEKVKEETRGGSSSILPPRVTFAKGARPHGPLGGAEHQQWTLEALRLPMQLILSLGAMLHASSPYSTLLPPAALTGRAVFLAET